VREARPRPQLEHPRAATGRRGLRHDGAGRCRLRREPVRGRGCSATRRRTPETRPGPAFALDPTPLALARATPDAVTDVVDEGVFEARITDGAQRTDRPCRFDAPAVSREERGRGDRTAPRFSHPIRVHHMPPGVVGNPTRHVYPRRPVKGHNSPSTSHAALRARRSGVLSTGSRGRSPTSRHPDAVASRTSRVRRDGLQHRPRARRLRRHAAGA